MKKKKKLKKALLFILIAFSTGIIYTALAFSNIPTLIADSFGSYPWYLHILFGFFSFALAITIHELGHFFTLRYYKIPVKAIYILGLVFIKEERWKIRFLPRFFLMLGGLVMPDISDCDSDQKFEKLKSDLSIAIKAGPQTSFFYGITTTLIFFIALASFNQYFLGAIFVFSIVNILMTWLVMKASNLSKGGLYGDFVLTKKINNDPEFLLIYILSSLELDQEVNATELYLWPKLITLLEAKPFNSNPNTVFLLNYYLQEIIFNNRIGCSAIDEKILGLKYLYSTDEQSFITTHHLVYWYYINGVDERVELMLNKLATTSYRVSSKVITYWQKNTEHLLGKKDNKDFLVDSKNYHPTDTQWLLSPLNIPIKEPEVLTRFTTKKDNSHIED